MSNTHNTLVFLLLYFYYFFLPISFYFTFSSFFYPLPPLPTPLPYPFLPASQETLPTRWPRRPRPPLYNLPPIGASSPSSRVGHALPHRAPTSLCASVLRHPPPCFAPLVVGPPNSYPHQHAFVPHSSARRSSPSLFGPELAPSPAPHQKKIGEVAILL